MGGFQKTHLNDEFKQGLYDLIIASLIKSCELMVEECQNNKVMIKNHEEKIRTHLLENYLESNEVRNMIGLKDIPIRFLAEVSEHYDKDSDTYMGCTDIRVMSSNWLANKKDYYTIECKRIDGTLSLNQKYIDDGVCRFTGNNPKYSSYNNKNIMFGFVVKNIDCRVTINNIADIHIKKLHSITVKNIGILETAKSYYNCESKYTNGLSLNHIFYDISSIVSV